MNIIITTYPEKGKKCQSTIIIITISDKEIIVYDTTLKGIKTYSRGSSLNEMLTNIIVGKNFYKREYLVICNRDCKKRFVFKPLEKAIINHVGYTYYNEKKIYNDIITFINEHTITHVMKSIQKDIIIPSTLQCKDNIKNGIDLNIGEKKKEVEKIEIVRHITQEGPANLIIH